MNLKKIISSNNGLSLIEVLVSLTILGIISIGIMNFFSQAYSFTSSNQNKTNAINVARNAMMYMEKQSFIEIKDEFDRNSSKEISLFICEDQYKMFWEGDTVDPICTPILVNGVEYSVSIHADNTEEDKSYILPITVRVEWTKRKKSDFTELEGVIKSEDIR
ncbi:prepilin-type N-terminal cleavage/methylation domain-containing protein [Neobacillus sp. MM2021_6]|uniref:type IV pilus modification PilV family protein n=1 Tax=Bacillaceae TaxID=186817 RepID=UPI00140A0AA0|nr:MULTISPECIES: prepilin-type N-terminal cleavage/methylation domain-containing protein [Bacillaceae]MBO0960705.1 prepilin-type N-terminal cleavage/methylation domain-containing protein [Neobacillus sp. MM2021_6]NHC17373.1 prepilin-type N-terminal cleavage/methylation domain-containing protein [Bacillus sp. MM2020_4]